jgi:hypothetical protein
VDVVKKIDPLGGMTTSCILVRENLLSHGGVENPCPPLHNGVVTCERVTLNQRYTYALE